MRRHQVLDRTAGFIAKKVSPFKKPKVLAARGKDTHIQAALPCNLSTFSPCPSCSLCRQVLAIDCRFCLELSYAGSAGQVQFLLSMSAHDLTTMLHFSAIVGVVGGAVRHRTTQSHFVFVHYILPKYDSVCCS